jgi:hypothetical protein
MHCSRGWPVGPFSTRNVEKCIGFKLSFCVLFISQVFDFSTNNEEDGRRYKRLNI